jgi:hypothetical protein
MRVGEDFCVLVGAAGPTAHRPAPVSGTACGSLRATQI